VKPTGFLDYVKAAFHLRPRIPGLGHVPANYLGLAAFAVLGLANPGFWFLGAALEMGYLVTLGTHPRFQRLVQGWSAQEEKKTAQMRREELLYRIDPSSRRRYLDLENRCEWILAGGAPTMPDAPSPPSPIGRHEFDQLLALFYRLLGAREMLLRDARQPGLRKDLQLQRDRIASRLKNDAPEEQLKKTLEATRALLERRIQILDTADAKLQHVEAELDRIEQQVALIAQESSSALRDPDALTRRIDAMTEGLGEATKWIRDLQGPLAEAEAAGMDAPPPPRKQAETTGA
jgi:hypothetical protein